MQWDSLESSISFGMLNTYKNRTFDVSEYVFRLYNVSNIVPNDPDYFFLPENLWTPENNAGTYAIGQQEKANIYAANSNTSAAYIMNELPLSKNFDVTYGVRAERNVNKYTGQSNSADYDPTAPRYVNQEVLNVLNILPSLNMVYKIRKDKDSLHEERSTNFRGAYTQTVARPSFREISISQIYDPIQGRRYLGNIDLKQTLIHNADLRWEHFFGRTEIISASAFYKKFINPIEIVANVAAPNEFKPVNAGEADVYGAEFELRKAIGFKSKPHIQFTVGTNFTYIVSRIDMNKVQTEVGGVTYTEKEIRQANARVGEVVGDYRPMYGQSPYIVNAYINYRNDSLRLMFNLTYNVQGKKLAVIGVGSLPDVYEQPFHSLNLKVSKKFGKVHEGESDPRWQASLRAQNLLNNARRRLYEAYGAESQIFDYLHQGMTFSGSISFTIQ
jgi:outer membrane receptor protein involved in Fe transport